MWPVLLKVGDFSLYSFGFFLFLGFFLAAFAVWKQARAAGLAEEKVFDALFLTTFLAVLLSRGLFVMTHWANFSFDYTRIILFVKYPGLSFPTAVVSAIIFSGLISKSLGLPVLWLWDIFALAAGFFAVFGTFGCFLDGCVQAAPYLPLVLAGLALVLVMTSLFLNQKLASIAQLSDVARRRGIFFLCYLIFQLVSLLMTSWSGSFFWREAIYAVALILVVGVLGGRYKELFIYFWHAVSQKRFRTN